MYHYVYRITNLTNNIHYYGCRSSKILPRDDLGKRYFSSSTDAGFVSDQKQYPHLYRYKIIKSYPTRQQAIHLEIRLHDKFNVGVNPNFYNQAKQRNKGFDSSGQKRTLQHRQAISIAQKGKPRTQKQIDAAREVNKQLKTRRVSCLCCEKTFDLGNFTKHIKNISNKGRRNTQEQKDRISFTKKKYNREQGSKYTLYLIQKDGVLFLCYYLWEFFKKEGVSPPTGRKRYKSTAIGFHRNRRIITPTIDVTQYSTID